MQQVKGEARFQRVSLITETSVFLYSPWPHYNMDKCFGQAIEMGIWMLFFSLNSCLHNGYTYLHSLENSIVLICSTFPGFPASVFFNVSISLRLVQLRMKNSDLLNSYYVRVIAAVFDATEFLGWKGSRDQQHITWYSESHRNRWRTWCEAEKNKPLIC